MTCPFSKFKDLFGAPNTGLHAYRVNTPLGSIAYLDVLSSLIISYGVSEFLEIDYPKAAAITFGSGIIAHRLFCVDTTIDKLLFKT